MTKGINDIAMNKTLNVLVGFFLATFSLASFACSPSDAKITKLKSNGRHGYLSVYGVLTHSCPQSVGFQLKLVVFDKNDDIVTVNDSWPASTSNIAPNEPYYFELMTKDYGRGKSFTVKPINVTRWK